MKKKKQSPRLTVAGRTPIEPPVRLPPILLEGDQPGSTGAATGFAEGDRLRPAAPARDLRREPESLPETYGTRALLLAAKEPHLLFAHWDAASAEQQKYRGLAADRKLTVRVRERAAQGPPAGQAELNPGSQNCSVPVPRAGAEYEAEVGYVSREGDWRTLAVSQPVATPPDTASPDTSVRFVTVAPPAPHSPDTGPNPTATEPEPDGRPSPTPPVSHSPALSPASAGVTSGAQPKVGLAPGMPHTAFGHSASGPPSVAATVVGRPQGATERTLYPPSESAATAGPTVPALAGNVLREAPVPDPAARLSAPEVRVIPVVTSPSGHLQTAAVVEDRGFWFNVNAELVLYGATEPDAQVAIGGEPIRLRPDGTFSYRLAFPDGVYDLVVTAVSAKGEHRQVSLIVSRRTD